MQNIRLTRTDFPNTNDNGVRDLRFTEKSLLRAVVVAGQRPRPGRKTRAARADADMRRSAILSTMDMSGKNLKATTEFTERGSTDKAIKSQYVGHALCAHAAYKELMVPWLADIENVKLMSKLKVKYRKTRKRPDFIGLDALNSRWFVFESKSRTSSPTNPAMMKKWKEQATAITQVQGQKVNINIVSAAYLNKQKEWELLWVDPVHEFEGINLVFDEMAFFDAYYEPIRDLIGREPAVLTVAEGDLHYISVFDAYVGLHKNVLAALEHSDPNSIMGFARERINKGIEVIDDRPVSVFADGILIALVKDLEDNQSNTPRKPKPKSNRWEIEV